jgi:serine-type D-Ala-D-Ala carboxypeptidase (penicillin-binding protein 5/6)
VRKFVTFVALCLLVVLPLPAAARSLPAPPPVEGFPVPPPPQVGAETWILYDDTYGVVLAADDPDERRALASTTKIMTALLAIEHGDLDRLVTVSSRAASVGEASIGLVAGEQVPLRALVAALLVRSGNDAATAVAEAVGGSVEGFVRLMNERAAELGLENTSFANPHGLDAADHYSSAADLLALSLVAMENPEFARYAESRKIAIRDSPTGIRRVATSTNRLLETYDGAIGVKTGFTSRAALVMVAAAERDGRRLYAVVMGSGGRGGHFDDAAALLDYGFSEFGVVPVISAGAPYATLRTSGTVERLQALGSVEVLVHLAGAGLLDPPSLAVQSDQAVLTATAPGDEPVVVELGRPEPAALPGLAEAVDWPLRYWRLLTGDG